MKKQPQAATKGAQPSCCAPFVDYKIQTKTFKNSKGAQAEAAHRKTRTPSCRQTNFYADRHLHTINGSRIFTESIMSAIRFGTALLFLYLFFLGASSFQSVKPRINAPPSACVSVSGSCRIATETRTATKGST